MTFGTFLKTTRAAASMTQEDLAEKSGVSQQTISRLERDKQRPGWGTLAVLCQALGVNPREPAALVADSLAQGAA